MYGLPPAKNLALIALMITIERHAC
ncbi:hypothetical protein EMIT0P176_150034 [Pseudomonas sp. IT-P176]